MKPQIRKDKDTVRRARPKKGFTKFLRGKVKTFNAHINEFEDDTASSTVVRWLVVVLLLHLVFIGGASLHGFLVKNRNTATAEVPATHSAAPAQAAPQQAAPAGTETQPITSGNSLVQTNAVVSQDIPLAEPVVDAPVPAAVNSSVKPGPARHMVATGDSWESIAKDNGCTVLDLKTVNPGAKLASGTTLIIPLAAGAEDIPVAEEVTGEESSDQLYVVKKGDTLSKIARIHKTTVAKLQSQNNITDPRKIKIGQEIRIPAK